MTTIETKLRELERFGYIEGSNEEMLIRALRLAVADLGGYATLPKGVYAGPDDLYHDLGEGAKETLTRIEKILGDQK